MDSPAPDHPTPSSGTENSVLAWKAFLWLETSQCPEFCPWTSDVLSALAQVKSQPWMNTGHLMPWNKKVISGFPLWLSGLRTQHCVYEDLGWITGLTRWVKDLALSQAAVWLGSCVAVAVVWACSCSSDLTHSLGTSICRRCGCKKKKKKM